MIFRDEKYMKINGTEMGSNGFKSLSFETSKYSGGFSASRGFGVFFNEKNLNQIDVFNVEFIITKQELETFARIYAQFKAFGVLPLENHYILNKIKSTLAYEKSLDNIKDKDGIAGLKVITHVNVFLESMQIRSLERTSNGYSVNMVLSINRFGFSQSEFERFQKNFNEWDKANGFSDICSNGILKNSDFTGIELEYISIEKLNAKQKNGILMQIKDEMYTDNTAMDLIEKENIRADLLLKHEQLNKTTKIEIPEKNIIQIELITNNNISNLPLYGEPIGLKSFMGTGSSTFIAKMIFDEEDSDVLDTLKTISDKDTTKTIMNIKNFLPNILDFNSASLNKIYFNNTEEANGVMVTMLFEINSYYYDLAKLTNIGNSENKDSQDSINSTLSIHQNITVNNVKHNNVNTASFWLETTAQQFFLEKNIADTTLISFLKTPIESYSQNDKGESLGVLDTFEGGNLISFTVEDYLKSYTSDITRLNEKTFVEKIEEYNKYLNIKEPNVEESFLYNQEEIDYAPINKFKFYLNNVNHNTIFAQDFINGSSFYNYFDGIGIINFFGSDYAKKSFENYFNEHSDPLNNFANKVSTEAFNKNMSRENLMSLTMKRFYYSSFLANVFEIINRSKIKEEDFITSNGIDFIKVKQKLDEYIANINESFLTGLESSSLFDESVAFVIEDLKKEASENKELLEESETNSLFSVHKSFLEPFKENFLKEFKNKIQYLEFENENTAYNIFLTKLNYALSKNYKDVDFKNTTNLNKYLNSLLLSTGLMSLFLTDIEGMTSHFGFISKDLANNIGYKLNTYLYIGETVWEKEYILDKLFGKFKINSYCEKDLNFYPWVNATITEDINKDYNYFFGQKIAKNSFGIFKESLSRESSVLTNEIIDDFIKSKKQEFINSEKNTEKDENIKPLLSFPTSNEGVFFENLNGKPNMNHRMKKRLIGNMDPFDTITKIKNLICDFEEEALPDYRIIVGNVNEQNNKGIFQSKNVKNYFELSNVAEVKVSKNPKNKIKNANIVILDFNKQLLNLTNQGSSISVKGRIDNKIEIFEIALGDHITIELGYGSNKKNVFNGYISSINNRGNVIEINTSGFASGLYSNVLREVDFYKNPLMTILNLSWKGAKALLGQYPISEALELNNIYQKFIERKNSNEHLFVFESEGVQKIPVNYSIPEQFGFESSMFIVFTKLLSLLPKNVKDVLGGYTQSSGASVLLKRILEDNKKSNTITKSGTITNLDGNSNIYKNIFNLDVDYETYGIVNVTPELNNVLQNVAVSTAPSTGDIEKMMAKDIEMNNLMFNTYMNMSENNMSQAFFQSTNNVVGNSTSQGSGGPSVNVGELPQNTDGQQSDGWNGPSINVGELPQNTGGQQSGDWNGPYVNVDKLPQNNDEKQSNKMFIFPTDSRRVTSNFSPSRWHPIFQKFKQHKGIDIGSVKPGTNYQDFIYASKSGIVLHSFISKSGGEMIIIDHGNGFKTRYLHLKQRFVSAGQKVVTGQKIGTMGNTGYSQAKHLHFEILLNNVPKNPMDYFNW